MADTGRPNRFNELFILPLQKLSNPGLIGFSVVFLLATGYLASIKPLWFDELFTFGISRIEKWPDLWSVISSGTDPNPPLYYLAARGSFALLGENEFAARLPAILGVFILCLCLYAFVSRNCAPPFAWLALLVPLIAESFRFAFEARPYGLVMGWCGLALVCWQGATETKTNRTLYLLCLAGSLGGAISTHYYAITILFPLVLGEGFRNVWHKRIDWPIWIALIAGLIPLGFYLPIIRRAQAGLQAGFWSKPKLEDIPTFYAGLSGIGPLCLAGALVFLALLPRGLLSGAKETRRAKEKDIPVHEIVAAAGFVLLPPLSIFLARLGLGVFAGRYLAFTIAGFSLLVAFAAARLTANSSVAAIGLVLIFACGFVMRFILLRQDCVAMRGWVQFTIQHLERDWETGLRVAISNPTTYLQLSHYAPEELSARLAYLASPEKSRLYLGQDTSDRALWSLREWVAPKVSDYDSFVKGNRRFLVYQNEGWLIAGLLDEGASIQVRKGNFFLVDLDSESK